MTRKAIRQAAPGAVGPEDLSGRTDLETLIIEGIEARKLGDESNWCLGDLALEVKPNDGYKNLPWGEGTLEKYAARIGVTYSALRYYRSVSTRFDSVTRVTFPSLGWSHFRAVIGREDALTWLARTEREGWSVEKLREQLAMERLRDVILPPGQFRVLYADPPWEYDNSGFSTSAAAHYPTLPTEKICDYADAEGRTASDLAGDDAVLFLWVTNPMLEDGLKVCEAWGFDYKTNLVWVKPNTMAGFYALAQHELLFIATRGSCLPRDGSQPPSVITAGRRSHSEKPDEVYDLIESMYEGPYVEGFARSRRSGWEAWGYELEEPEAGAEASAEGQLAVVD